jgi:hypothetical protein
VQRRERRKFRENITGTNDVIGDYANIYISSAKRGTAFVPWLGMLFDRKSIERTLLTMGGREGEILSVVVFTDGEYGIARDGRPIDGLHWPRTALDDCMSKLLWLAGKSHRFGRQSR